MRGDGQCDRGCRYEVTSKSYYFGLCGCGYMDATGKSRVAAVYRQLGVDHMTDEAAELLKPENCPCYCWNGKKRRKRRTGPTPALSAQDAARLRELHGQGLTDREIGKILGVSGPTVGNRRRSLGLPVNREAAKKKCDWELARKLHGEGRTDREIAEALGCSTTAVMWWRMAEGLLSNARPRRVDYRKARKLYDEGLNDREIAEALGSSRGSVWHWREQENLPGNVPPGGGRGKK